MDFKTKITSLYAISFIIFISLVTACADYGDVIDEDVVKDAENKMSKLEREWYDHNNRFPYIPSDRYWQFEEFFVKIAKRKSVPHIYEIPFCDVAKEIDFIQNHFFTSYNDINVSKYDKSNMAYYGFLKDRKTYNLYAYIMENCLEDGFRVNPITKKYSKSENSSGIRVQGSETISYDQMQIIIKEAETCRPAKTMIAERARENNILSVSDHADIMREILFCKNLEVNHQVNIGDNNG